MEHTKSMNGLFRVIIITYIVSLNVYSYLLIYFQKKQLEESNETSVKDAKLFLSGLIGGAVGIYVSMFIYKYRLQNLLFMILVPMLIVLNAYVFISIFTGNFAFFSYR